MSSNHTPPSAPPSCGVCVRLSRGYKWMIPRIIAGRKCLREERTRDAFHRGRSVGDFLPCVVKRPETSFLRPCSPISFQRNDFSSFEICDDRWEQRKQKKNVFRIPNDRVTKRTFNELTTSFFLPTENKLETVSVVWLRGIETRCETAIQSAVDRESRGAKGVN